MNKKRFSIKCMTATLAIVPILILPHAGLANMTIKQETDDTAPNAQQNKQQAPREYTPQDTPQEARELTASELNARQQIRQTVTVRRRINGNVVEEKKITVPSDLNTPARETEAGDTLSDIVRRQVDLQVLTRREALAEAELDFTLADSNNDGALTAHEYAALYDHRRSDQNYTAFFTDDLDTDIDQILALEAENKQAMTQKFNFLKGIAPSLSRADYIREALRDFDSMDHNGDYMLRDTELADYRAALMGLETPLK